MSVPHHNATGPIPTAMSDAPPLPQTNVLAWLSLFLGILAPLTCGATAPFAILFGFLALRRINLADGTLPGARLARTAIVLGVVGLALFFGGFFFVGLNYLREKAEITTCANNLRRIGQAINQYADQRVNKHYPRGTIPNPDLVPDERLSWMVSILPFMEDEPTGGATPEQSPARFRKGGDVYARFDLNQGWQAEPNRQALIGTPSWFVCPAAKHGSQTSEVGWTQYVGLSGFGTDAPTLPKTDPRAGFFGYDRVIGREDITRGTTPTMIVTERARSLGPWSAGGPPTVTGIDPRRTPYIQRQFGGLHPNGANTLFADTHVEYLTDRRDSRLWDEQCRINVDY
jgi:prepilin-type processing-associated H-X9-DG protein